MKHTLLLVLFIAIAAVAVVLLRPMPAGNGVPAATPVVYKDLVIIELPLPGTAISSPVTVRGKARGPWYFEASFPVALTDGNGRVIAQQPAQALGEWMTTDWVPFEAVLTYDEAGLTGSGMLILRKDNPSGLPEHDDAVQIPVTFTP